MTCTFLVTAVILLVFNPAAELKILMRIQTKEAKTEIETHLEAAETKLLVQCNVKPQKRFLRFFLIKPFSFISCMKSFFVLSIYLHQKLKLVFFKPNLLEVCGTICFTHYIINQTKNFKYLNRWLFFKYCSAITIKLITIKMKNY